MALLHFFFCICFPNLSYPLHLSAHWVALDLVVLVFKVVVILFLRYPVCTGGHGLGPMMVMVMVRLGL